VIVVVIVLAALVAALAAALAYRSRPPKPRRATPGARRILLPFTGDSLDPTVLAAAIRIARAEGSMLVPAYLLLVPLQYSEDSPLTQQVGIAMPLLEAVENAALRAGVPVDARIEKGRTPAHALGRLWEAEQFDRVVAPAPTDEYGGFSPKDLTWILGHAPAETLVLRPARPEDLPLRRPRSGGRTTGSRLPRGRKAVA
jgi:hypothetical protein